MTTAREAIADFMPLPRSDRERSIFEAADHFCEWLGVDPEISVETLKRWIAFGKYRDELAAEFGEPVRLMHPAPCDPEDGW